MSQVRTYNHSGTGNGRYSDIEAGSTFTISGIGNVTINGTIGQGATIVKSGIGTLRVNAIVGENVKFQISGIGAIKFTHRPPASVLRNIQKSGICDIAMPGGWGNNSDNEYSDSNDDDEGQSIRNNSNSYSSSSNNNGTPSSFSNINGQGISVVSRGGIVRVTQNGVTTSFAGKSAQINNNRIFIDGQAVNPLNRAVAVAAASILGHRGPIGRDEAVPVARPGCVGAIGRNNIEAPRNNPIRARSQSSSSGADEPE